MVEPLQILEKKINTPSFPMFITFSPNNLYLLFTIEIKLQAAINHMTEDIFPAFTYLMDNKNCNQNKNILKTYYCF